MLSNPCQEQFTVIVGCGGILQRENDEPGNPSVSNEDLLFKYLNLNSTVFLASRVARFKKPFVCIVTRGPSIGQRPEFALRGQKSDAAMPFWRTWGRKN